MQQQDSSVQPKKPYSPPQLVTYGEVRVLTQTSTAGSSEGSQGSGVMKPGCDVRLKEHIVEVGRHPALGIGLYLFDYRPEFRAKFGAGRQFGVLAHEVESVLPAAVLRGDDGYQRVDLAQLGILRPAH